MFCNPLGPFAKITGRFVSSGSSPNRRHLERICAVGARRVKRRPVYLHQSSSRPVFAVSGGLSTPQKKSMHGRPNALNRPVSRMDQRIVRKIERQKTAHQAKLIYGPACNTPHKRSPSESFTFLKRTKSVEVVDIPADFGCSLSIRCVGISTFSR